MRELLESLVLRPDITRALDYVRSQDEATLATQIELSEIPAPPFDETARAEHVAGLLRSAGLTNVRMDAVGNVLADRPGTADEPPLVVSAHVDTVFPAGTDVSVVREGSLLKGPGISDDARGLAALVAIARALAHGAVRTRAPLLFVATVGEEGPGDLRGVKALFGDSGPARHAGGFVSLDGAGSERIVARGLGSRRFRVTIRGPGGHSWVDWGTPNPVHALVSLGARLASLKLPTTPKTTLTIARLGGGKSINAIPQSAWLETDTRSADGAALEKLEGCLRREVEVEARDHPDLTFEVERIGDRPGGATPPDSRLVRAAVAATRRAGQRPDMVLSSTDANIPMTLGIPAITIGCGGDAGRAHTTEEWFRNTDGAEGIVRALCTVLLAAGVAEG